MQHFLDELPSLILSTLLIAMLTLLLLFRVIAPSDQLVGTIATALISFWFLSGAFKWQPGGGSTSNTPAALLPSPAPVTSGAVPMPYPLPSAPFSAPAAPSYAPAPTPAAVPTPVYAPSPTAPGMTVTGTTGTGSTPPPSS